MSSNANTTPADLAPDPAPITETACPNCRAPLALKGAEIMSAGNDLEGRIRSLAIHWRNRAQSMGESRDPDAFGAALVASQFEELLTLCGPATK